MPHTASARFCSPPRSDLNYLAPGKSERPCQQPETPTRNRLKTTLCALAILLVVLPPARGDNDTNTYFQTAMTEQARGERDDAFADYGRAIEHNPRLVDAYVNRAYLKRLQGDFNGALADYDKAIQIAPDYALSYNNRANAKTDHNDLNGALADLNKAIQLEPDYVDALFNRGQIKCQTGDLSGALADYTKAIAVDPSFVDAYVCRGNLKNKQGDSAGALADFNQAIALQPAPEAGDRSAGGKRIQPLPRAFINEFNRNCATPDFAVAFDLRGDLRQNQGDLNGANADHQMARQLHLQPAAPSKLQEPVEIAGGGLYRMPPDPNQLANLNPDNATVYFRRGSAKASHGEFVAALADLNQAIELNPDYPEAYRVLALIKIQLDDRLGALADVNHAIKLSPKFDEAYRLRGTLFYQAYDFADALTDFRHISNLKTGSFPDYLHFIIWMTRSRLGETAAATAELQAYLKTRRPLVPTDWPINIARFLTGDLAEAELIKIADTADANHYAGRHCEVWFTAGSKRLINGDQPGAMEYFKKCVATGLKLKVEYMIATAELNRMQTQK